MGTFDQDIDALLTDLHAIGEAVEVVKSGTTVYAIPETGPATRTDETGLTGEIEGESFLMKAGALSLSVNDAITVDGTAARVRSVQPEPPDGAWDRVVYAT